MTSCRQIRLSPWCVIGLVVLILTVPVLRTQAGKSITPAAIALSPNGDLFVLDLVDGILKYPSAAQGKAPLVIASFTSSWEPNDMTIAQAEGEEHLFVTLNAGNYGQLMQYSDAGRFEGSWFQFSPLGGICADELAGRVYTTAWGQGQLLQQPFFAPTKNLPQPFYRFINSPQVGPLALDPTIRVLFAADIRTGAIYMLDLASNSMSTKQIADNLGLPTAMAYDSGRKQLYIADGAGRRIWSIAITSKVATGKATIFMESKEFRQPSSIAIGTDGSIWVGDQSAHAIFHFSPNHQLLNTLK